MAASIDLADVPAVSAEELFEPMRMLIGKGLGLALLRGLDEAGFKELEDRLWQQPGDAQRRLAVAVRLRGLIAVFGARRLQALMLERGFALIAEAVSLAATSRLNARRGFNPQRFVSALKAVPAARAARPDAGVELPLAA